jgi:hypothetical protein
MKAGDIVFVRGKTPISTIVRWFDEGDFSHVAVAVSPTHIIEAEYRTKIRISKMEYDDYEIVPLELSDLQRDILVHLAIQLVGIMYDFLSIIGIIFNKRWNLPQAKICTEVVVALLLGIGYLDKEIFLKPNELYRFLTKKEV